MIYIKKGFARLTSEKNGRWNGGKPKCIICQKQLSNYGYKYCLKHRPARSKKERIFHNGYYLVRLPNHPYAGKNGYIKEHRAIMEKHLGRILEKDEIIHHINGNKLDNRIENFMILTSKEHNKIHSHRRKKE